MSRAYKKRNKASSIEYLIQVFSSGCTDCGEKDIKVLEFDHIKEKKIDIASLMYSHIDSLKQEIAKCEVVCANCHRRRTCMRGNHWRNYV